MGAVIVSLIFSKTSPLILSLPCTLQMLKSGWLCLPPGLLEPVITAKDARCPAIQFYCLGSPKHQQVATASKNNIAKIRQKAHKLYFSILSAFIIRSLYLPGSQIQGVWWRNGSFLRLVLFILGVKKDTSYPSQEERQSNGVESVLLTFYNGTKKNLLTQISGFLCRMGYCTSPSTRLLSSCHSQSNITKTFSDHSIPCLRHFNGFPPLTESTAFSLPWPTRIHFLPLSLHTQYFHHTKTLSVS